jgi:hypothetical protein
MAVPTDAATGIINDNPAFWIWSALYFTAPILVLGAWLVNRRYADPASDDLVAPAVRGVVTAVGVLALIQGAAMFISPSTFLDLWPWTLSPLSCRTLAAVCCLGGAGVGIWNDARWSTLRQMHEIEIVMVGLILLAALRARDQLDSSKPLAWPMLIGFSLLFFASIVVWSRHGLRSRAALKRPAPSADSPLAISVGRRWPHRSGD